MTGITTWIGSAALALGMGTSEPTSPPEAGAPPPHEDSSGSEPPSQPPESEPDPDPAETPPSSAAIRAQQHFQAEEWEAAIEALMEAYANDPDPAYLYARAQAERMRGNCQVAIPLYQRFLEHKTTEQQREDTQRHIRLCEEILFNEQAHPETTPVAPMDPTPPDDPTPPVQDQPRPPTHPWYRDPAGLTLLASGTAAVAVGGILWGLGAGELRRAPRASTEDAYEQHVAQGRRDVAIGATLVVIGASLALSGTIRLGVVNRRHRLSTMGWLGPGSGGLAVRTRF